MTRDFYAARRATRAAEIRTLQARVRELMSDRVERYSSEVAFELGLDVQRACPTVAYVLKTLETEGVLKSRRTDAPRSGLGRRYYRWASTVARARGRARADAVEAERA
jgi:hypothetical protein